MKKLLSVLISLLILCGLAVPAMAAPAAPQITMQPQNYHYPANSVAVYTVKAEGTNLHATWYIEYEGKTYNLSDNQNPTEPWEAYAGANYGPMENGPTNFSWFFGGIEEGLNGARIWCVIEDGHYDVKSERAILTVQGAKLPPEILQLPASVTVNQGGEAEIRCVAKSGSEGQLAFQWYETTTGKLPDIRAIDGEDCDFLICNTQTVGTRYYVCCVTNTDGGMVYSAVVPVNVAEAPPSTPPATSTSAPETTSTAPATSTSAPETSSTVPASSASDIRITGSAPISSSAEATIPTTGSSDEETAFPWWGFLLIALGGIATGVGIAVIFLKQKKES